MEKLPQSESDRKSLLAEVYDPCSGNDVAETATDRMDEELVERHSNKKKAAKRYETLAEKPSGHDLDVERSTNAL